MAERLTEKFKDGRNIIRTGIDNIHHAGFGQFYSGEAVDKLAEYENAEDEGRLLILPCKAGDTVYHVGSYSGITRHTIRELIVDTEGAYACSLCKFPISQFGVSVFLTYEEAEKALGELREK